MSARVSVVMPVYNAGKYLPAAIESVLAQTMPDFELILVDDGSIDGSADVCDRYVARDPRVHVVHQKNSGICVARNVGMSVSKGKWLAFCDHDDLYMPTFLERALQVAESSGCHVVKVGYTVERRFVDGRTVMVRGSRRQLSENGVLSMPDLFAAVEYRQFKSVATYIWDGVFDRDFLLSHGLCFDERFEVGGEDVDFMLRLLSAEKRIGWVGERCYRHFKNIGSSTSLRYSGSRNVSMIWNAELMGKLFPACGTGAAVAMVNDKLNELFSMSFEHPECPLSVSEKAKIVRRLFEAIAPGNAHIKGGCGLLWFAKCGWFRTYVVLKTLARKARRLLCPRK